MSTAGAGLAGARDFDHGRAMVMTGELQLSQWAGLAASPSGFSTDSFSTYWPFGTV